MMTQNQLNNLSAGRTNNHSAGRNNNHSADHLQALEIYGKIWLVGRGVAEALITSSTRKKDAINMKWRLLHSKRHFLQ